MCFLVVLLLRFEPRYTHVRVSGDGVLVELLYILAGWADIAVLCRLIGFKAASGGSRRCLDIIHIIFIWLHHRFLPTEMERVGL